MSGDPKDRAKLASLRQTERMGMPSDTMKEPARVFTDIEKDPARGPRGTMLVRKGNPQPLALPVPTDAQAPTSAPVSSAPATPKPNLPASSAVVAGEVQISPSRQPQPSGGAGLKVDVSRADPRRAPTRKLDRRPDFYVPPDLSVANRERAAASAPRKRSLLSPTVIGLAIIAVLLTVAGILLVLVLKQRGVL